jgi:capsular polysaccharide biosynthesis protein
VLSRIEHRMPRRRRAPGAPAVERFDELEDVEVTGVELPEPSVPETRSRSVQPSVAPQLTAPAHHGRYPLCVAVLPHGHLVSGSGAVVAADHRVVRESVWDDRIWHDEALPRAPLPEPTYVPGRHASLITMWGHGFYHWMFEALPRLAVLEASGVRWDGVVVPEHLSRFHRETLAALGLGPDRLIPYTGQHLEVEELVWPSPMTPVGRPSGAAVRWLREHLGAADRTPVRRLYLTRGKTRRVANEPDVLGLLQPLGFEVVDPDELTLGEQVELFAGAELAVGPHGAAFSNAIFSHRMQVLEIYQPAHVNPSTLCAVAAAGHEHWSLVGRRVPAFARPRHHDVHVAVDDVRRSLAAMGA